MIWMRIETQNMWGSRPESSAGNGEFKTELIQQVPTDRFDHSSDIVAVG